MGLWSVKIKNVGARALAYGQVSAFTKTRVSGQGLERCSLEVVLVYVTLAKHEEELRTTRTLK